MIKHFIHYFSDGFHYSWSANLPYRLVKQDLIYNEFLDNLNLLHNKELSDAWNKFSIQNEFFEVGYITIGHMGAIEAWLMPMDEKNIPEKLR